MATKQITITWQARYHETVEVPDDWDWDGDLDSLLEFTDMPIGPTGELFDWGVS